jgi:hypothetical protein
MRGIAELRRPPPPFDPGDVRGPLHGLLSAVVFGLHRLIRIGSWSARPAPPMDDAAAVRAMADRLASEQPSFAQELRAIAARHEEGRA